MTRRRRRRKKGKRERIKRPESIVLLLPNYHRDYHTLQEEGGTDTGKDREIEKEKQEEGEERRKRERIKKTYLSNLSTS